MTTWRLVIGRTAVVAVSEVTEWIGNNAAISSCSFFIWWYYQCFWFCLVECNNFVAHHWRRDVARLFFYCVFILTFFSGMTKAGDAQQRRRRNLMPTGLFLFHGIRFRYSYSYTSLTSVIRWWNCHLLSSGIDRYYLATSLGWSVYIPICASRSSLKYYTITNQNKNLSKYILPAASVMIREPRRGV